MCSATPIEQFFLGDQSIPVRDEKSKEVEHLRLDVDPGAGPLHRHAAEVDMHISEFAGSRLGHCSDFGAGRNIIGLTLNHHRTITTLRSPARTLPPAHTNQKGFVETSQIVAIGPMIPSAEASARATCAGSRHPVISQTPVTTLDAAQTDCCEQISPMHMNSTN
jgi:hypothetical protein